MLYFVWWLCFPNNLGVGCDPNNVSDIQGFKAE